MDSAWILAAKRTPIGSFQGALSESPAPQLGAHAIRAALAAADLHPEAVDEVIMGQVLTAGAGQAPARQAALGAGLPQSTPCLTINKVCGSGLKAVMLASDQIRLGQAGCVIAGGQENMTLAPHLLAKSRSGFRMGNTTLIDSMVNDGLWDPYNSFHMGNAAELCVAENAFSREAQDAFAIESYQRARSAIDSGAFKSEIAAVDLPSKKGPISFSTDEEPGKADFAKIPNLKPAFDKSGTITAANASKINDGAAATVIVSERFLKDSKAKAAARPLARIVAYATHAQDPKWFTTAPVGAMQKCAQLAGLTMKDIDLFEINEAFAAVAMVAIKDLKLDHNRVNVNGGAVALGHPIGASGARILSTLVYALQARQLRYGMASLCIGGGEAVAMIIERNSN